MNSLATPASGGIPALNDGTSEGFGIYGAADRSYQGSQVSQNDIIPTVQPSNFNF